MTEMNWKAHLIVGIIVSVVFAIGMWWALDWYQPSPLLYAQMVMIVGLSTLLPDIDHKKSKIGRLLTGIGLLIASIGILFAFLVNKGIVFLVDTGESIMGNKWSGLVIVGIVLASIAFFTSELGTHRGFTHSIAFCVIIALIVLVLTKFNLQLGTLAFVGCYSHLLADKKPFKVM